MHKFLVSLLTTRNLGWRISSWLVDRRREEKTKPKMREKQKDDERENRTVCWKYIYKTPHVRHDGLRIWNELTGCFRIFPTHSSSSFSSCLFLVSFPFFVKTRSCSRNVWMRRCVIHQAVKRSIKTQPEVHREDLLESHYIGYKL